jgi:hypothetical protein
MFNARLIQPETQDDRRAAASVILRAGLCVIGFCCWQENDRFVLTIT